MMLSVALPTPAASAAGSLAAPPTPPPVADDKTLFQKIADGEIPAEIVYQDEQAVAFRDTSPVAPTHVLVVPRQPIPRADAVEPADEALVGHLFTVARQVADAEGLSDYRLVVNNGAGAGQSVFHLHVHLIGGRALDCRRDELGKIRNQASHPLAVPLLILTSDSCPFMIEVHDVQVAIDGTPILHGVSFEVAAGTVAGYVGPNGAGKTTTMRLLTGALPPDSGRVVVAGVDVAADPVEAKRQFGYVPEHGHVYESFTPAEYLAFIGRMHRLPSRRSASGRRRTLPSGTLPTWATARWSASRKA